MARISQLALAACLALSALHADAFTTVPSQTYVSTRNQPLFLSTAEAKGSTLKRLPESAVELTLHVPAAATAAAYDKVLTEVSKKVSIPGFRKGAKIPPQVIENAWSKNGGKRGLKTMAINELVGELIESALKDEHELEPIGQPSLVTSAEELAGSFTPGDDLDLTVKCDVWPEIKFAEVEGQDKPYSGLKGSYKRKPFNQERFDAAMRDLLERYAKLEQYDDASHELTTGDACKVNMVGYMATADGEKGEPLPNAASGDDVEVILGEGRYMEGLVEGLEGGKVGETKTVKVRFPAALKNKELAGKDAIFDVEILSASRRTLPELTDEFANQVREGLTADSLKEELRKAVDSQDAQEYMGARNEALGKALSEIIDVEVPDTLVTNQAREKYALMMTDMRDNGMADEEIKKLINPENFIKYKDISKPDIVRDFKISMAVDEIARLENIQVPAYQVEEQIESLKDQAVKEGQSTEGLDDEQMRRKVESTLERRMVYDLLAEVAELEVEYVNDDEFDQELMEKLAQESLEREQAAAAEEGKQEDSEVTSAEVVNDEIADVVEEEGEAEEEIADSEEEEIVVAEEEPEPVKSEDVASDTVESEEATTPVEIDASRYEGMDEEEKAFSILKDLGMIEIHADPDSPDFDASIYAEEED